MKKFLALLLILMIAGCKSSDEPIAVNFVGKWTAQEGPYVSFNPNEEFEFGVKNDPKPLVGKYSVRGDLAKLTAESEILGDDAITILKFQNHTDSLKLVYVEIQAKKFSVLVDVKNNYAKTVRGNEIKEIKLTDPEAPDHLFAYYELTRLVFKKS